VKYEVFLIADELRSLILLSSAPCGGTPRRQINTPGGLERGFAEADVSLRHIARMRDPYADGASRLCCELGRAGSPYGNRPRGLCCSGTHCEILGIPSPRCASSGITWEEGSQQAQPGNTRHRFCPRKDDGGREAFLTREETFLAVGNRPPATMRLKAGVKKDGTLTAGIFLHCNAAPIQPAERVLSTGLSETVPVSQREDRNKTSI